MGHIVGYDYVRSIQYVLIIRASRLVAFGLVVGNRCVFYVLQLHRDKRSKDTISPICDELPKYVQRLLIIAKCHTQIAPICDELLKYVQKLLLTAKRHTSTIAFGNELHKYVLRLLLTAKHHTSIIACGDELYTDVF